MPELGSFHSFGQFQEGEIVVAVLGSVVLGVLEDGGDSGRVLTIAGSRVVVFSERHPEGGQRPSGDAAGRGEDIVGRNQGPAAERNPVVQVLDDGDVEGDGVGAHGRFALHGTEPIRSSTRVVLIY